MKEKKPFIIDIVLGIILVCIGLFIKIDYYSTLIFAMGIGLLSSSIVQIARITYWQNPKRQTEYEAKLRTDYINKVDERKQFLRMKAGHITYQIMTFALLILSFILSLFRVDAWITGMIFLLFIFQWIIGVIVFRILQKQI